MNNTTGEPSICKHILYEFQMEYGLTEYVYDERSFQALLIWISSINTYHMGFVEGLTNQYLYNNKDA